MENSGDVEELLRNLSAWLKWQRETNVINRSVGKGGHDGNGTSWSAVAIPEWDVRQKIEAIDEAVATFSRLRA